MSKHLIIIGQHVKARKPLIESEKGSANIGGSPMDKLKTGLPYIVGTAVAMGGGLVIYNKIKGKDQNEDVVDTLMLHQEEISVPEDNETYDQSLFDGGNLGFGPAVPIEPEIKKESLYGDTAILEPESQEETTDLAEEQIFDTSNPIDSFMNLGMPDVQEQSEAQVQETEIVEAPMKGAANSAKMKSSHPLDGGEDMSNAFGKLDIQIDEGGWEG